MHPRQRDRSAASLGSEHQNPSRTARKPMLPELPQRAKDRSRGAPQIRQAERDRSAASLGSEHQNPSRIARKPILPELPQRAQDRSRGAPTPTPCSPSPASAKAQPVPTFPPSAINEDYMAFAFGNGIVISSVRWTDGRHSKLRRSHAVKSLRLVRQRFRREQEKARTVIGGRADHGPMGWGQREVGAGQHGEGRAGVVGER